MCFALFLNQTEYFPKQRQSAVRLKLLIPCTSKLPLQIMFRLTNNHKARISNPLHQNNKPHNSTTTTFISYNYSGPGELNWYGSSPLALGSGDRIAVEEEASGCAVG